MIQWLKKFFLKFFETHNPNYETYEEVLESLYETLE
jgi:hypothetical protein